MAMSPPPIWRCNEVLLPVGGPFGIVGSAGGFGVFNFDKRDLVILAVALCVAAVLGVWGAFGLAGYLAANNPNDPLTTAGGLSPAQDRALRAK
jgi:hypothetical protein